MKDCTLIVRLPCVALILEILANAQVLNLIRLFEELCRQAQSHVPGDMTVHEPGAGVVRDEGQHEVPAGGEHGDITARRVLVIECLAVVEDARARTEDVEVVAVQVDRMREGRCDGWDRLDDPIRPGVRLRQRDQIRVRRVRRVPGQRVLQRRLVPFNRHGREIEIPLEQRLLRLVLHDRKAHVHDTRLGDGIIAWHVQLHVWHELGVGVAAVGSDRSIRACRVRWKTRGVGAAVAKHGQGVFVQIVGAAGLRHDVKPVVRDGLVGVDDDVVTFSNTKEQRLGDERFYGHEIGGDDGEIVPVKADFEVVVGRRIDEPQPVFLPLGDGCAAVFTRCAVQGYVGAVDQDIVARWRTSRKPSRGDQGRERECRGMVPIRDRIRSKINVVVGRCRTVDDDGSHDTVRVLV